MFLIINHQNVLSLPSWCKSTWWATRALLWCFFIDMDGKSDFHKPNIHHRSQGAHLGLTQSEWRLEVQRTQSSSRSTWGFYTFLSRIVLKDKNSTCSCLRENNISPGFLFFLYLWPLSLLLWSPNIKLFLTILRWLDCSGLNIYSLWNKLWVFLIFSVFIVKFEHLILFKYI